MARIVLALFLASIAITAQADAAQTTFKLIAPDKAASGVTVTVAGGTPVTMTKPDAKIPQFVAVVEAAEGAKYKYTVGSETESFDRTVPTGRTETYNDFFKRVVTVQELPPFPWALEDEARNVAQWQRAAPKAPLFDDSYIPTLYFSGDSGLYDAINSSKNPQTATMYVILKDQILTYPTSYAQYKADSWKIGQSIAITQGSINGRTIFKLRTGEFDPTQLREKTYTDLSNALGVPVAQQVHVRVYVNGEPLGLFILTDLMSGTGAGQLNFGFTAFEGGDSSKASKTGILLDCGTGATFAYKDDIPDSYAACYGDQMGSSGTQMVALVKALDAVDDTKPETITAFEAVFDIDTFLRQMVMEYLAINWDGYWAQSSNFVMYLDKHNTGKWFFSDQDFDQTFGNGNDITEGPSTSYTTYPERQVKPSGGRPLITKLLATTKYKARFEEILKKMVQHTFNEKALNRRFDVFTPIIRPEVEWDHSFKADGDRCFYFADFDTGLTQPVTSHNNASFPGGVGWGLKSFITTRAAKVAQEFSITIDDPPHDIPADATSTGTASGSSASATETGSGSSGTSTLTVSALSLLSAVIFASLM